MKPIEAELSQTLPLQASSAAGTRTRLADYLTLSKPRLNALAVATTAVGFYLGSSAEIVPIALFHTILGTAFVAAGASALNQLLERRTDGLMNRTRMRPLPDGRLGASEAGIFGAALSAAGIIELALGTNQVAAFVAFLTLASYVTVYTPLKPRTSLSTLIGAIPGALPAVIGWAAATGSASLEAWTLFAIVFLWQMPHFLAIAWMYRADYERAGFPLLPVLEPDGRSTGRQATLYAASLIPISLLPGLIGMAGTAYVVGAFALGCLQLAIALKFASDRTTARARSLFLVSILYLPLLWGLMIADRGGF
jgi:protoheme IX farnesyltransferase